MHPQWKNHPHLFWKEKIALKNIFLRTEDCSRNGKFDRNQQIETSIHDALKHKELFGKFPSKIRLSIIQQYINDFQNW